MTLYLYASHGSPERVIVVLSSALLIIVPADILRLNCSRFERSYEKVVGFLMRESEKVRHVPPIIMSLPNRTSFDIFHSYFAETNQRCDMVHPRCALCTLAIPLRYRSNLYHDVCQHPFDRPTLLYLTSPQQPLLGGHSRFNIRASMGPSHSTAPLTRTNPRPPVGSTQVPCRFPRRFDYWRCDCILILELAGTGCRWGWARLGLGRRCIRSGY